MYYVCTYGGVFASTSTLYTMAAVRISMAPTPRYRRVAFEIINININFARYSIPDTVYIDIGGRYVYVHSFHTHRLCISWYESCIRLNQCSCIMRRPYSKSTTTKLAARATRTRVQARIINVMRSSSIGLVSRVSWWKSPSNFVDATGYRRLILILGYIVKFTPYEWSDWVQGRKFFFFDCSCPLRLPIHPFALLPPSFPLCPFDCSLALSITYPLLASSFFSRISCSIRCPSISSSTSLAGESS